MGHLIMNLPAVHSNSHRLIHGFIALEKHYRDLLYRVNRLASASIIAGHHVNG